MIGTSLRRLRRRGVSVRPRVTRIDLDGPSLCRHDPVSSNVGFHGPEVRLGEAPGLGITRIEALEMIDG